MNIPLARAVEVNPNERRILAKFNRHAVCKVMFLAQGLILGAYGNIQWAPDYF